MERQALKDLMYGGIAELIRNRRYYYSSGVNTTYNYWTDEGNAALIEYTNMVAGHIARADAEELDYRAKQMVMQELKGTQ